MSLDFKEFKMKLKAHFNQMCAENDHLFVVNLDMEIVS